MWRHKFGVLLLFVMAIVGGGGVTVAVNLQQKGAFNSVLDIGIMLGLTIGTWLLRPGAKSSRERLAHVLSAEALIVGAIVLTLGGEVLYYTKNYIASQGFGVFSGACFTAWFLAIGFRLRKLLLSWDARRLAGEAKVVAWALFILFIVVEARGNWWLFFGMSFNSWLFVNDFNVTLVVDEVVLPILAILLYVWVIVILARACWVVMRSCNT